LARGQDHLLSALKEKGADPLLLRGEEQWWLVLFKMREDNVFVNERGLISIRAYWMTVIHI
jgi:hypothetical protein